MAKKQDKAALIAAMRTKHVKEANAKSSAVNLRLAEALKAIDKRYGKEAITTVTGRRVAARTDAMATGWQDMDDLLTGSSDEKNRTIKGSGIGLPRGRIIEIYGPEASGKTTTTLHWIAAMQRAGGKALYMDVEHALDTVYAANLGVDLSTLLISQPDNAEQAADIVVDIVKSKAVDLIVVDSVSALVPEDEDKASVQKSYMALQARLMSKMLRKLPHHVSAANCIVVFVNQVRMKIGVMFGNPETTSGGNALKFYASIRLDCRMVKTLKSSDKTRTVGRRTRLRTVKNKAAPPFREIHCDIEPNKGIVAVHGDPNLGGEESDD